VTDYISRFSKSGNVFVPRLFQGFPEIKEALISNKMQAGFMVAPMAIALRSQGVPIKIVYLGHRYGSAVVVRKDGPIKIVADLRGRIIAIPNRFSDERLIVFRALARFNMTGRDVKMVEMAPSDGAGALATGAVDAFSMGEPYPSQAEMGGYGRVLFHAREFWPDYILVSWWSARILSTATRNPSRRSWMASRVPGSGWTAAARSASTPPTLWHATITAKTPNSCVGR
jgi:NitT/TauT family transport system substrate-binding protein